MNKTFRKIRRKIEKNWQTYLLVFFMILMIIPYSYISLKTEHKFYSPDETANFVFTQSFIETNNLYIEEPLNSISENAVFPRSVNVIKGKIVPQSFVGMPFLYGIIGKLFSLQIIPFLTPIFSLLGVFIFYLLLKDIFNKNIAFFSSILLLFNPIFWYLAGKAMTHNNLFFVLALSAIYSLTIAYKRQKTKLYIISAFLYGAAVWVRASEAIWLGLTIIIFYCLFQKKIRLKDQLSFIITGILSLIALFGINYTIYDNIFRTGYNSLQEESSSSILTLLSQIIIPFGLNIKALWLHLYEYLIKYLWFIFIPGIFGIVYSIKSNLSKVQKFYLYSTIMITVYLILFYGSYWPWGESGQPSEPQFLIGSPHLRYWLPLIAFLIPFTVIFAEKVLTKIYRTKLTKKLPVLFIILMIALNITFSIYHVFFDNKEGFLKIIDDVQEFSPRLNKVSELVESNAVIVIPSWADRIFFPEFSVVHSPGDKLIYGGNVYAEIQKISQERPVYFYSADSEIDIQTLNENELQENNLELVKINEIYKGEKLYLIKNNE